MASELTVRESGAVVESERSVPEVLAQMTKVQELMKGGMQEGEHFGVIPGSGTKKTLLKPGAEKLCFMFRMAPAYAHKLEREGRHLVVESTCALTHIPSGLIYGTGSAMCSTYETKYAYRKGSRTCPKCEKPDTIIKGKAEFGGGWLCWPKKGGCNAKFKDGDATIEGQEVGRIANEDTADQWNTVVKMSDKRALIAAVLNATAASDIFTQDLDELQENLVAARREAGEQAGEPEATEAIPQSELSGAGRAVSVPKTAIPEAEVKREIPPETKRPPKTQPVETTATPITETTAAPTAEGVAPKPGDRITPEEQAWLEQECAATGAILSLLLKQKGHSDKAEVTYADMTFYRQMLSKRSRRDNN